jgi:Uma2 family endonuclease
MTLTEYFHTPQTVLPRELAFGVMRVADAPLIAHQRVVAELFFEMTMRVEEERLGEVIIAPIDVVLDAEAALVVQPDIVFVSNERAAIVRHRVQGAPDLVVDVLSPHPRIGRLNERTEWYARYGVRECWLASVPRREIVVLTFENGQVSTRELFSGDRRIESELLGELPITPSYVFRR